MLKEKIKKDLHTIIDDVDDDQVLSQINFVVNQILKDKKLNWDSLGEEERNSILRGLEELEKGEITNYEDLKRDIDKWLRK